VVLRIRGEVKSIQLRKMSEKFSQASVTADNLLDSINVDAYAESGFSGWRADSASAEEFIQGAYACNEFEVHAFEVRTNTPTCTPVRSPGLAQVRSSANSRYSKPLLYRCTPLWRP